MGDEFLEGVTSGLDTEYFVYKFGNGASAQEVVSGTAHDRYVVDDPLIAQIQRTGRST